MARTRIHVRLVLLGGVMTGALTLVWALAYLAGTGDAGHLPLVTLVLGPAAGALTALAAARLTGHPVRPAARKPPAPTDDRPAVPARGAR